MPAQWLRVCSRDNTRNRREDEDNMAALYLVSRTETVRNKRDSAGTGSARCRARIHHLFQGAPHARHRPPLAPPVQCPPIACALAELAVPHQRVKVDITTGEQRRPACLALNPNGKVPTLTVDGAPMFEALAIAIWLGEH